MNEHKQYISELLRIISGALRLDVTKVRNYVAFLADQMEAADDAAIAKRLRQMLAETDNQLRPAELQNLSTPPTDSESRFALLELVRVNDLHEDPIVLKREQLDVIEEFISVAKSQGQLEVHGIITPTNLLLYGPPGCGKSRLARHIAKELGMPLFLARLDGIISSFLGSTAKNIRSIFDFVSKNPCVLLLDEFDAIAKLRDDKQELGELKRVVNSFLQNLDTIGLRSIVIAATNHHSLLDPAVWRRFSYTLQLDYPQVEQRRALWQQSLKDKSWGSKDIEVLVDLSEGFSGAEIHDVAINVRRQSIIHGTPATLQGAFGVLKRIALGERTRNRFLSSLGELSGPELVRKLRKRNPRLYSHAELSSLVGTSKATTFRWQTVGAVTKNG